MKTVYNGMANGVNWTVSLDNILDDDKRQATVEALIDQGLTIIMQRVESGKDRAERAAAVPKTAARIESGDYSFGGSGTRGPRQSWTEKAERKLMEDYARDTIKMKAVPAKEWATKPEAAWVEITRRWIYEVAHEQGMDADEVKALDIDALVEHHLGDVKEDWKPTIAEKAVELEKAAKTAAVKPSKEKLKKVHLGG